MFPWSNSDDSDERPGEEAALPQRKVLSWRQKDEYGSDSDTCRAFHVDNLTTAKLQGPCFMLNKLLGDISKTLVTGQTDKTVSSLFFKTAIHFHCSTNKTLL